MRRRAACHPSASSSYPPLRCLGMSLLLGSWVLASGTGCHVGCCMRRQQHGMTGGQGACPASFHDHATQSTPYPLVRSW